MKFEDFEKKQSVVSTVEVVTDVYYHKNADLHLIKSTVGAKDVTYIDLTNAKTKVSMLKVVTTHNEFSIKKVVDCMLRDCVVEAERRVMLIDDLRTLHGLCFEDAVIQCAEMTNDKIQSLLYNNPDY